jgi:hypothetical protein
MNDEDVAYEKQAEIRTDTETALDILLYAGIVNTAYIFHLHKMHIIKPLRSVRRENTDFFNFI